MKEKFYISTALPYVNSVPHLGFALEIVETDAIARYQRMLGKKVFFLTGTDENSLKNVQAAKKQGISTKALVDKNAKRFFELKKTLNLSFDDFIRTTEKRHILGAQKLWKLCKKDIYKKKYRGLYCVGCEEYYKESELVNGLCPEHKTKPALIEEENYFFRLSKYQNQLKKIIEKDEIKIVPETRKNEVLSFIERGLEDICISRSTIRAQGWGIDVPEDKTQKIWVWFDALSNYITALGFAKNSKNFKEFWIENGEKVHVIGKGILRFHAVYWPAMLLSANLPLPSKIFVHGYLTVGGQKISKSLGNIIDPFELVQKYGTDSVRYFLLREASPFEDLDFTFEKFEKRYNDDLAKGLGNFLSRVLGLAKKLEAKKEWAKLKDKKIKKEIENCWKKYHLLFKEFKFNEILISIWNLISFGDKYLQEKRPWETKEKETIFHLIFLLKEISKMLSPFLPQTSQKILEKIKKRDSSPLFPKISS
ncbi:methionine--tRNA ligase [Candidatus Parcubacteria bacterium]|nr:methionine--tRNA ligase [Candidatus Parcubacteria bacterium]